MKEENEKYYSMTYEFNTENPNKEENAENTDKNRIWIIILIFIIIFIITLCTFLIILRKMRIKNKGIEYKINNSYFSSEINEDIFNNFSENSKDVKNDEHYFI